MYVYVCPAGSGGLLPIVLCGDLNSTPNSPLVDFITSSFLNYSKMSATEIAGYHHDKGRSRVIPTPLLPPSMNIGPNCMYTTEQETDTANATSSNGIDVARATTTRNNVLPEKERKQVSSLDLSSREGNSAAVANKGQTTTGGEFVQSQNENFKDSSGETQSLRRYSIRARSARGAKARGMSYSGVKMSNSPSLLRGGKSSKVSPPPLDVQSVPSSSGLQTPDHTKAPNSPTESGMHSCTEESDMEWEKEKTRNTQKSSSEGTVDSQTSLAPGAQLNRSEQRKKAQCHMEGLITHPFKFVTAYPQSRVSTPSTVTTFHQSAFETVDYIFYTPPTKKKAGFHLLSRKALPSTHVLLDLGPQPHRYLSSDHLPLQVNFQLVSRGSK